MHLRFSSADSSEGWLKVIKLKPLPLPCCKGVCPNVGLATLYGSATVRVTYDFFADVDWFFAPAELHIAQLLLPSAMTELPRLGCSRRRKHTRCIGGLQILPPATLCICRIGKETWAAVGSRKRPVINTPAWSVAAVTCWWDRTSIWIRIFHRVTLFLAVSVQLLASSSTIDLLGIPQMSLGWDIASVSQVMLSTAARESSPDNACGTTTRSGSFRELQSPALPT